jgi:ketosteroid isomerase-like protein
MTKGPLPHALTTYYQALDGRRFEEALACFAPDVLYAVPPAGGSEVDARRECRGREALLQWFGDRGPRQSTHQILLWADSGDSWLIEGVVHDSLAGDPTTFAASLRFNGDGVITRYLAYMCAEALPADHGDGVAIDAGDVLDAYFVSLESGAFEKAAECFSDDVLYSHPPYQHTGITDSHRINFRGREALLDGFRRRGRTSFNHRILVRAQHGPHCLIEGTIDGLPEDRTASFLSSLSLDADGHIRRYVSFYCEPAVGPV